MNPLTQAALRELRRIERQRQARITSRRDLWWAALFLALLAYYVAAPVEAMHADVTATTICTTDSNCEGVCE